jgi:hypothetical protein
MFGHPLRLNSVSRVHRLAIWIANLSVTWILELFYETTCKFCKI